MPGFLERAENAVLRPLHRPPLSGVAEHGAFWSAAVLLFLLLLRILGFSGLPSDLALLVTIPVWMVFTLIILYRWLTRHVLWKVRNRLVVTYLLMGLAPVVLFATLIGVAAYILAGQFATFAATSELNSALGRISAENQSFDVHVAHAIAHEPTANVVELADYESASQGVLHHMEVSAWVGTSGGGQRPLRLVRDRVTLVPIEGENALSFPAWAHDGFRGTVLDHGHLFLRAVNARTEGGHKVTFISSAPLEPETLNVLAEGLGVIHIIPDVSKALREEDVKSSEHVRVVTSEELAAEASGAVSGGELPSQGFLLDRRITFPAPLTTTAWANGDPVHSLLTVTSRPTLLYSHLFGSGINIGSAIVRYLLIPLTILFALIELVAFIMAVRLNRTITNAIADLYRATVAIDSGNFAHRIRVLRRDQLAALSTSFNTMSESLERLLEQQREKERMQSELEIAQEVQNNLFPHGDLDLPGLELFGVCRPARTVSGDYYDFLLMGESELTLAMGDISGKGISAALLMASLHSAVRAYRLAGEECPEDQPMAATAAFTSPGKVLGMLNRQLYRSTQPEKYATLFLAHFNTATRRLVYSNGGQLPPFVLRADGRVVRLDHGGSVVGLLDSLSYDEGTVTLDAGDILVAYSDGVTEPENEFGEFGEERLIELIQRHRHLPLSAIAQQVLQAIKAWIGEQEQPDDITVVLVRQSNVAHPAIAPAAS